jgi:hypothetical protein
MAYRWGAISFVTPFPLFTTVSNLSEEGFREESSLGEEVGSGCRVVVLYFTGCKAVPGSVDALKASLVENIRVSRFVIDGFSAAALKCGLEGGAACPLRFSTLGTALPFCPVAGRDSGDPMMDDAVEAVEEEAWGLSAMGVSLCAMTVAIVECEVLVKRVWRN